MALKQSRRARRMQRHHGRSRRQVAFNMVSLMDIFTILVFFLLVNSSDVQVLPSPRAMTLPESIAEQPATTTPVIMLTRDQLLLDSKVIGELNALIPTKGEKSEAEEAVPDIPALTKALRALPRPETTATEETDDNAALRAPITIMSDKDHPFTLIEKVMRSCVEADRPEISLAVLQGSSQS